MTTITIPNRLFWPTIPIKNEYLSLAFWLIVFLLSPRLIRLIDITAAPIDPGALTAILMSVLAVLLFKAVTWWLIRSIWPAMALYSETHFSNNFNALESWQKISIYLAFYVALLLSFVCTLTAMF